MERPSLTFKLSDEREIKWTYGLATDIQRMVPGAEELVNGTLTNPYTRDYVVRRLLTDKKGFVGDEDELIGAEELDDLDPDVVLSLTDWATGHLLYFFANSAGNMKTRLEQFGKALPQSAPSQTGSKDSASSTQSAGPSE